jgi:photosystem II stability/assembly factor-like uncharacterized protein
MAVSIRVVLGALACLFLAGQCVWAHEPHDPITTVAVSPNFTQDQTVFAASDDLSIKVGAYALFKSTDGGVNWSVVEGLRNNGNMPAIVFSPAYAQDQTIFVAANEGLFATTDQGTSWSNLTTQALETVALSPNFAVDNTLFIVTKAKTILESTNRGQTLTPVSVPASLTAGLNSMAVSPNFAVDKTLLLGSTADGIFKSTNAGASWVQVTAGLTLPAVNSLAISPNFSSDQTAFAGAFGAGILMSTNGGSSWAVANSGISDLNITCLALSPDYVTDSTLWISTAAGGVFRSTSRGASWTQGAAVTRPLSNLTSIHYQSVAVAKIPGSTTLFLGMFEGLWKSTTWAASWNYIDTIPTRFIRYINLSPNYAQDQTIFASTYGGGNLWSTDGGTTWVFKNTGMFVSYTDASGISPNFANDGIAFSAMGFGLERTNNQGAQWQKMAALGAINYPRGLAVSPNFAVDSTVLIGIDNGADGTRYPPTVPYQGKNYPNQGLFLSTDGGDHWIPTSLSGPAVISIAMSPAFATDRTAFAASPTNGLYKSTDGGMTWTLLSVPAPSTQMAKVAVSPNYTNDQVVIVGVITGGVYKSTDAGSTWSLLSGTNAIRAMDIKFSPNYAVDRTFFIGTVQYGLMKSTNGGNTNAQVTSFTDSFVTAVALSPNFTNDQTIFAAGYHGLFKSTDGGSTWTYQAEPARIEESRNITTTSNDSPPTITFDGNWSRISPSHPASTDSYELTSYPDAAILQFVGSGVRWISWTGPTQGSATITLDGVVQGTVSLNAATSEFQQTVWEQHGIPCGPHTFVVTASPGSGQSVTVDAFDIWLDTCPFTGPVAH